MLASKWAFGRLPGHILSAEAGSCLHESNSTHAAINACLVENCRYGSTKWHLTSDMDATFAADVCRPSIRPADCQLLQTIIKKHVQKTVFVICIATQPGSIK